MFVWRKRKWLQVGLPASILIALALFLQQSPQPNRDPLSPRLSPLDSFYIPPEGHQPFTASGSEGDELLAQEDYWITQATYPTGRFDARWLLASQEQDAQIVHGTPAGISTESRSPSLSPLPLQSDAFIALGPQPLQMDGCADCLHYGIVSGRVNTIVSDFTDPTIAYLGSVGGGVWKTTNCCDEATIWQPMTDDPALASIAIGDLTISPHDHLTLYAGTGDLRFGSWSFGSHGILKSTDGGQTWEVKGTEVFSSLYDNDLSFPQYQAVGKVRVDPRNSNNVIATAKNGVFFSYDAGNNWTGPCLTNSHTNQRQDGTGLIVTDNGSSTDVYVAVGTRGQPTPVQPDLGLNGANGIYHTTLPTSGCPASWELITRADNGWIAGIGSGTPNSTIGRIDIAPSPSNPAVIYAQVAHATLSRGLWAVYRTDNGGLTWTQGITGSDLRDCDGSGGNSTQNWFNQGVIVDPHDPLTVFMNTVDLWRSTNGGNTFTNLTCGYSGGTDVHVDHHALAYVNNSSATLLIGNDGGAYVTQNANASDPHMVTFTQLNHSLNTLELYAGDMTANFADDPTPSMNAGAQDNGSMVHTWHAGNPSADQWQMTTDGDGIIARIEPKEGQIWFQSSQGGFIKRSMTGSLGIYEPITATWSGDIRSFITPYEIDKYHCPGVRCNHMMVGTNRVWESINIDAPDVGDILFYPNSPNLTKNTLGNRSFIKQLTYAISDHTIAIAGTLDGNVQMGFGLGQGSENSATWVNVTGGNTLLPNRPIMDVTTHPLVPTIGLVAVGGFDENTPSTPGHIFQLTCNVDCTTFTWQDKSGNLPNIPFNTIMANPHIPEQVFAGSDWGLYYTDDITAEAPLWHLFSNGLPRVVVWDITIDHGFTTLALFTRSRGVYAWLLPEGEQYSYLPMLRR